MADDPTRVLHASRAPAPATGSVPVLLISGPVGVGKSTAAGELSESLAAAGTPHTFIDFDNLRHTYPRPADDPWGDGLAFTHLSAIWSSCAAAGSRNLVVATVVETQSFVDRIGEVVPGAHIVTCQLDASLATLAVRVRSRERGSGLDWHLRRAGELAAILKGAEAPCDVRIDTEDRSVVDVAAALFAAVEWRGA